MKLIDANVIIYSVGREHEYRQASQRLMEQIRAGDIAAVTNTETLQELLHYFHSRGRTAEALRLFDRLTTLLPAALAVDLDTASLARDLIGHYPRIQTRDAFHAATVFQYRLEGIISADRGFDEIAGLTRFDPKALAANA